MHEDTHWQALWPGFRVTHSRIRFHFSTKKTMKNIAATASPPSPPSAKAQKFFRKQALAAGLALALPAGVLAQTARLNDTGQTLCYDAANDVAACNEATTGNTGERPGQDARYGRDAATFAKTGGGEAGFDFTRICWNGHPQGHAQCTGTLVNNTTGTASGTPATDWACTRDNVTGLVWSLQTRSATWAMATAGTYPNAGHNSANRCGYADGWRMPTRRELLSIVHHGMSEPSIDPNYFPAPNSSWYWSADAFAPDPANAWHVYFYLGFTGANNKTSTNSVRLVRSGQ